jgi:DNA-directed RNA polymerase subunit omega
MARITVEDCLAQVPNRFTLVLVAAERAKQLLKGTASLIDDDRENKEIVTSLREIAAGVVVPDLADFDENLLKYTLQPAKIDPNDELPPEAGGPLPLEADSDLPPEAGE